MATTATSSRATRTTSWDRGRLQGRCAAEQHPDEGAREGHQPDRSGLVQTGDEGEPGVAARHQQPGVAIEQAQGQGRLDLAVPRAQRVCHPAAGKRGRRHGPADEDADHRDDGDRHQRHHPGREQDRRSGQGSGADGHEPPDPAAGPRGCDPAPGCHRRDGEHEGSEACGQPPGVEDGRDDRPDEGQLERRPQGSGHLGSGVAQPGHSAHRGGERDEDGQDEAQPDEISRRVDRNQALGGDPHTAIIAGGRSAVDGPRGGRWTRLDFAP